MFSRDDYVEYANAARAVRKTEVESDAERATEILAPWFEGLATILAPLRTYPVVPDPGFHEELILGAYEWTNRVLVPGTGNLALGAVLVQQWLNPHNRTIFRIDYHTNMKVPPGASSVEPEDVWTLVYDYASRTLVDEGEFVQGQANAIFVSTGGGDG